MPAGTVSRRYARGLLGNRGILDTALPQRAGPGYAPIPPGSKRPGPPAPVCAIMMPLLILLALIAAFGVWLMAEPPTS
jgi:hypothetical protein